jgi:DNA-binding transcriptional ArsR family regulator
MSSPGSPTVSGVAADEQRIRARNVEDPKAWRALAHPLRLRIIEQLWMRRSVRAKDLAESLGEPANSVSFHLRQLARFGYVEPDEDREPTDARERWWRPTSPTGFAIDDAGDHPDAEALVSLLRQQARDRLEDWYTASLLPESAWERVPRTASFGLHLLLTGEERDRFLDELAGLLTGWMQVSQDSADDEAGAREEFVMVGYAAPQWAYDEGRRRRTSGG